MPQVKGKMTFQEHIFKHTLQASNYCESQKLISMFGAKETPCVSTSTQENSGHAWFPSPSQ